MEVLFRICWYVEPLYIVRLRYIGAECELAFNIVVTFPVIFFFFKETKQVSLEDIDLLFGERALGTLPEDLHKENVQADQVVVNARTKEEVEGGRA